MHTIHNPFAHPLMIHDEGYRAPENFLILGLGESGVAMAKWCLRNGAVVSLADTRSRDQLNEQQRAWLGELEIAGLKEAHFGELQEAVLQNIDVIGISPGLSPLQEPVHSFLAKAQDQNVDVWSEIEFFARAIAGMKRMADVNGLLQYGPAILAVTGTNGKTTTTALTGQLCERAGKRVAVAGNISPAALDKLMSCLDQADQIENMPEVWVLELSSFQLLYTHTLDATAATVLNITQDHLDWHGDMQAYISAKGKIFGANTIAVLNRDDPLVTGLLLNPQKSERTIVTFGSGRPAEQGDFGIEHDLRAGGIDWLVWAEVDEVLESEPKRRRKSVAVEEEPLRLKRLIPADALRIRGRHNALNALAALALARAAGLPMNMLLHGLRDYQGEPHRVQSISVIADVEYVDDSKGTNVGATVAALNGLGNSESGKRIWLIAGGEGKGQDFSPLRDPALRFVKGAFLIGKDAAAIAAALGEGVPCVNSGTLQVAVKEAAKQAQSGDIVLLSPACASLDQFRNYVERAEVFACEVQELSMGFEGVQV